jgi:hypothetical protein
MTRLETARFALASSCWARGEPITCDQEALIDLLTDLRHLCAAEAIPFDDAVRISLYHFTAETKEEQP